ncbi:secreted protein [Moelleriella libera RCEF 2490]|uniref:Secreted protein n=1 Tax=Moelleriella libera RCEF 2490 TaxID=1081109 RepID=A0A168B9H1_9HYPO|nr:secreted protein [Moelleriella libera RCEF 2490]
MKFSWAAAAAAAGVLLSALTPGILAAPIPVAPGVPSTSTARTLLNGLTVDEPGSGDGYQRSKFPTWVTIEGNCNTRYVCSMIILTSISGTPLFARDCQLRAESGSDAELCASVFAKLLSTSDAAMRSRSSEFVIKRDGSDVKTNSACVAQSGTWVSPYDGDEFDEASELDIDHLVPLKNAWISGAADWTTADRKSFANDITRPQLWAVSAHANRAKGDKSPDHWKPDLQDFWCTYSKSWIQVKSFYNLTVTEDESGALASMLDTC